MTQQLFAPIWQQCYSSTVALLSSWMVLINQWVNQTWRATKESVNEEITSLEWNVIQNDKYANDLLLLFFRRMTSFAPLCIYPGYVCFIESLSVLWDYCIIPLQSNHLHWILTWSSFHSPFSRIFQRFFSIIRSYQPIMNLAVLQTYRNPL